MMQLYLQNSCQNYEDIPAFYLSEKDIISKSFKKLDKIISKTKQEELLYKNAKHVLENKDILK